MPDAQTTKERKRELDVLLKEAELREALAAAEKAEHEAALKKLERIDEEHAARHNDAHDIRHHVYWFNNEVTSLSAGTCISTLRTWDRLEPECDITIYINSPGGGVIDGMALFDELTTLSKRGGGGHHITTIARGYAASMAGVLLQAGDERLVGRESYLLIHELSALTFGKVGEIEDDVKLWKRMGERVVDIFLDRADGKITKAQFVKNWSRTDWWLDSDAVMKYGFADRIG